MTLRPRFLALALVLVSRFLTAQGTAFYASDEAGMAFEEIPSFRTADHEYFLEVSRQAGKETRVLRSADGRELKSWICEMGDSGRPALMSYAEGGKLTRRERYDGKGFLVAEEVYEGGGVSQRIDYSWADGRLTAATARGGDGLILYSDSYLYSTSGSLREMRRTYADGRIESAGADSLGGKTLRSWQSDSGVTRFTNYALDGRPSAIETWREGAPLLSEERRRSADGGLDILEDTTRGTRTEREYGKQGRLATETTFQGKKLIVETIYAYDPEGRLSEKTISAGASVERVIYAYDGAGNLAEETHYVDGELQKKIITIAPGKTRTELYRLGSLYVRYTSVDGRKRSEEIIVDGKVVRSREFR